MLTAVALILAQALPVPDGPRTLRVGGGEYATPEAAAAAARAGDTVRVTAGIYRGPLRVETPRLVLVGEPGAVLDGGGRGSVLTVAADSVEVRGLELRGSGRSLDHDDAAVKLERCTGCRLRDNLVDGSLHGIYLLESQGTVIERNRVRGDASLPEARRGNGIHLFHSGGSRISENDVRGTRDGIYFSFSSGNRVERNEVTGVRYGLHYMYSDDNYFRGNRFTRNAAGAAIMFSRRIVFEENTFAEHVGYRAYGILLQTAYEIEARRNRIERNLVGIFLDMSSQNTFRENRVAGNGIGVDMIASAEDNTFVGNAFVANRTPVRKPNGAGLNTWAEGGRGNFWGAREVFDLDGDGVGDRPYPAGDPFAALAALRPVLEVFAGTPAALALSWAERAFPVFDLPQVVDPAPLVAPPAGAPAAEASLAPGRPARAAVSLLSLPFLALAAGACLRRSARRP